MARGAELASASGDDWALVHAKQAIAGTYLWQQDYLRAAAANDEVAALAERVGDPFHVARRWLNTAWLAVFAGRVSVARDNIARARAAASGAGDTAMESSADSLAGIIDIQEGEAETARAHLEVELQRALKLGAGMVVPFLLGTIAWAELGSGRPREACERLEGLLQLIDRRALFATSWALWLLAEAKRLLDDAAAEATAVRAQASGQQLGNLLFATAARLTLGRLAAARGEWTSAREHALAHLDACVEGGHVTYVPACLDALAEVAAGLEAHEDATRLFAAAERARAGIGIVRVPPEEEHWAEIENGLREVLGDAAYEAAHAEGAELSTDDALEWARRARGPRKRPAGGWESLTPTEVRVAELVAEGLTNPQVAERMFVSPGTVKTHLSHIFGKLDVHSRAELTAEAVRRQTTG
jgi:DNA-binding NarL/FixJ family response regulator